jgi:hypothetical protein
VSEQLEEILDFRFDVGRFVSFGRDLFVSETEKTIRRNVTLLGSLERKATTLGRHTPVDSLQIYDEFIAAARNGYNHLSLTFGSRRKVRKLAWSLGVAPNGKVPVIQTEHFSAALQLIEDSYRPSMLLGVLDCLLEWWTSLREPHKTEMMKLVETRLSSYTGRNPKLTKLKERAPYFIKATGPAGLAADLIKDARHLSEVWDRFEFANNMRRYSYFSEAALQYIQASRRLNNLSDEIPGILDFLRDHTGNVKGVEISKRIISVLVQWVQETSSVESKQLLKREALNMIGDPQWKDKWSPWPGITDSERATLNSARSVLKEWLATEIIEIFFGNRMLGMDKRRKTFWLKHCKHIDQFKLYSNPTVLYSLSDDDRVKPYAPTRLGRLTGGANQLSALVFTIKGYLLVEFSATGGAFYAYKIDGRICPDISARTIDISDLRRASEVEYLINRETGRSRSEGRFNHSGDHWESYLSHWIERYIGV